MPTGILYGNCLLPSMSLFCCFADPLHYIIQYTVLFTTIRLQYAVVSQARITIKTVACKEHVEEITSVEKEYANLVPAESESWLSLEAFSSERLQSTSITQGPLSPR